MSRRWWVAAAAMCLGACTEANPVYDPDPYLPGECRQGVEVTQVFDTFERPDKLDVLFVVDASGDPLGLQTVLADSVLPFLKVLETSGAHTRVAVATTSLAEGAKLARPGRAADGCDTNDVVVAQSSSPNFAKAVRCNILQGPADDDRFDQPLAVVDGLLEGGAGTEFLREDARLLIVILSRDDDCSTSEALTGVPADVCPASPKLLDVQEMVESWRAPRVTSDSVGLVVFGGPPTLGEREDRPVCSSTPGSMYPANRLYEAVTLFGDEGFFFGACTDDMAAPLLTVADRFVTHGTSTFCPEATLVHEPLSVVTSTEDVQDSVPLGAEGFVFLGGTEECEHGAVQFSSDVLMDVEEVAIEYCTVATP